MPLARIDVPRETKAEHRAAIGMIVHEAMCTTLDVPEHDHFQVIGGHAQGDLAIDRTYLSIERSAGAVLIQPTLNKGRSVELKKAFYKAVADGLRERIGIRREDVVISLIEVTKDNWSFGNGEAQYA